MHALSVTHGLFQDNHDKLLLLGCHEDCVGLGMCLDSTAEQCCNYYNGDNCVITCPGGLAPNAQFECGELSAWV